MATNNKGISNVITTALELFNTATFARVKRRHYSGESRAGIFGMFEFLCILPATHSASGGLAPFSKPTLSSA